MQIITSGNILEGIKYQVLDNTITYDSTTYNPGDYFIGTTETTYTGTGSVYEATVINSFTLGFQNEFVELFPEGSTVTGIVLGYTSNLPQVIGRNVYRNMY